MATALIGLEPCNGTCVTRFWPSCGTKRNLSSGDGSGAWAVVPGCLLDGKAIAAMGAGIDGGDRVAAEEPDEERLAVMADREMVRPRARVELNRSRSSGGRREDEDLAGIVRDENLAGPAGERDVVYPGSDDQRDRRDRVSGRRVEHHHGSLVAVGHPDGVPLVSVLIGGRGGKRRHCSCAQESEGSAASDGSAASESERMVIETPFVRKVAANAERGHGRGVGIRCIRGERASQRPSMIWRWA